MNFYERRRRIMQLLRMRPLRPRCSLTDLVSMVTGTSDVTGRSSSECEIHIDGNMFFWIAGVAGAGLAFLTYQAITMMRRRRKRRDTNLSPVQQFADMLWLGRNIDMGVFVLNLYFISSSDLKAYGPLMHVIPVSNLKVCT